MVPEMTTRDVVGSKKDAVTRGFAYCLSVVSPQQYKVKEHLFLHPDSINMAPLPPNTSYWPHGAPKSLIAALDMGAGAFQAT